MTQPTARQLEILALVAEGHSPRDIAAQLWLDLETVRSHLHNAARRLGVRGTAAAVAAAIARRHIGVTAERGTVATVVLAVPARPEPCPSEAAYQRHRYHRQQPCDGCRAAHAAWMRDYQAKARQ